MFYFSFDNTMTTQVDKDLKAEVKSEAENIPFTPDDGWLRQWAEPEDIKEVPDLPRERNFESEQESSSDESIPLEDDTIGEVERFESHEVETSKNSFIRSKYDEIVEKIVQGDMVSENFSNLCSFICPKCSKKIRSWHQLNVHCKNDSDCHTKISGLEVTKLIVEKVFHVCKLCSVNVLCDTFFIKRHVQDNHGVSAKWYIKKFALDRAKLTHSGTYSESIGNLCVYQCGTCHKQSTNLALLRQHLKNFLHTKESMIKKVFHQCNICHKTFLCIRDVLRYHFKKVHNISLLEYCKRTGCDMANSREILMNSLKLSKWIDNLCIFACSYCKNNFGSSRRLKRHKIETGHNNKRGQQTYVTSLVRGYSYKCAKCSKLLLCDKQIIKGHMSSRHKILPKAIMITNAQEIRVEYKELCQSFMEGLPVSTTVHDILTLPANQVPINELTSTIGNLCTFSCPNCESKKFNCWAELRKHFKFTHKIGIKYSSSLVVTARYHACLLCTNAVLSDRYILTCHLTARHKMAISKYEEVFRRHGGQILPSFRTWLNDKEKQTIGTKAYLDLNKRAS